ncbi:glycosyltransferase [Candidatus Peregrinibacteria bacterium]|nr:glycosyltransferase [Candidatus Peregrinibacteria bacterium]
MKKTLYSILIPVYNEEKSLEELYSQIQNICRKNEINYKIIFIDDGSTDKSLDILQKIQKNNKKRVKIISFSKNFGKSCALQAGFDYAKGEYIFTIDADLQDDPKEIPNFIKEMKKGKFDVVSGWKYNRKDPSGKKIPSKIANVLTKKLSKVKIHDMNCGFKLFKKNTTDQLEIHGDMHRFIPTILSAKGFKIGEIKINHRKRKHGKSKYGAKRLITGFFDFLTVILITKYLQKPLHFFGKIGLIILFISGLSLLYLFIIWLMGNSIGTRPLFIFSLLLFILSIQIIIFGLVAELIIRNNNKKHFIINKTYE